MKKYHKHVIIVGSARSGTSWVSETIAKQHRYRMLFEPEHEKNTTKGHLICDKYITHLDEKNPAVRYLRRVFSNRVNSDWIAQNSNRKWKRHLWPFVPKKFVIKFIRCNLSAKWMNAHFGIPVIHVIRNPYEVLYSQNRVKFPWLFDLKYFEKQEELNIILRKYYGISFNDFLDCTDLEKLTLRWCLENLLALKLLGEPSWNYELVRYEDLRNDIKVFEGLCNKFHLRTISNLEREYIKPSTKTHPKSDIIDGNATVNNFNKEELEQINKILTIFSMDLYPYRN